MKDRVTWADAVRVAAGVSAAVAIARGVVHFDRESIAIGVGLAIATGLTFTTRYGLRRVGWVSVAALFVNQAFWMVSATIALTRAAPSLIGAAVPVVLAVAAVFGLIASLARARAVAPGTSGPACLAAAVVALVLTVVVPAAGAGAVGGRAGDLRITTSDLAFHPEHLEARAGDVAVLVRNKDLFWHTFTVNQLNLSVSVPTGGTKRLVLPHVSPGAYDYVCAVPGHESAGMKGVLVVR